MVSPPGPTTGSIHIGTTTPERETFGSTRVSRAFRLLCVLGILEKLTVSRRGLCLPASSEPPIDPATLGSISGNSAAAFYEELHAEDPPP